MKVSHTTATRKVREADNTWELLLDLPQQHQLGFQGLKQPVTLDLTNKKVTEIQQGWHWAHMR